MRGMQNGERSFTRIYEGPMSVHLGTSQWGDSSSTYYSGDVGFTLGHSSRRELDRPTVLVTIPIDTLFEENSMKRLKSYFLKMEEKTTTYTYNEGRRNHSLYDCDSTVHFREAGIEPESQSDPRFWSGDVSYVLSRTSKLEPDKPTMTAEIPLSELGLGDLDDDLKSAAADVLLREFGRFFEDANAELYNRARPEKENGRFIVHVPSGEVLVRNTAFFAEIPSKDYENGSGINVYILPEAELKPPRLCFCVRMQVQLPLGKLRRAMKMLVTDLPECTRAFIEGFDRSRFFRALELAKKQKEIRANLAEHDLVTFIANGSILPREGETELPMRDALPFESTPGDEIELAGVRGMGIKRGVTVITGGGYSGKSTLLDAIAAGIYDHCEGDGRELVLTDQTAVEIAAEDGRSVGNVNISPFIKWLSGGKSPRDFSTAHASGSTSQAANILEAIEAGSSLLLIDEDRSATNFMIRDAKMKRLIEREPITPFTDRVRELAARGVSTLLVIGGSGEYLSVADRVYLMDDFKIRDVTELAKELADEASQPPEASDWRLERGIYGGFSSYPSGMGSEKLVISETGFILIGDEAIDTRALHGLVTREQVSALGFILRKLAVQMDSPRLKLDERLSELYDSIERDGLDEIFSSWFVDCPRFLELPRQIEVQMAFNRMRKLERKPH